MFFFVFRVSGFLFRRKDATQVTILKTKNMNNIAQRKIWIGVLLILTAILGVWHYLFRLPFIPVHPLEALSVNAPLSITSPKWQFATIRTDTAADEFTLQLWAAFPTVLEDMRHIDKFLLGNGFPQYPLPTTWTLQNPARKSPDVLAIINLQSTGFSIDRLLQKSPAARASYRGHTIFTVRTGANSRLTLAAYRNLLLIAPEPIMVEEAIGQLSRRYANVFRDGDFRKIYRKGNKKAAFTLLLHTEFLGDEMAGWLNNQAIADAALLKDQISWVRLDLQASAEGYAISGALAPRHEGVLSAGFAEASPLPGSLLSVLPGNTASFNRVSMRHFPSFSRRYGNERLLKQIAPWVGTESALVITEPVKGRVGAHRFLVLSNRDPALSRQLLGELLETGGQLNSYEYQTFTVRQLLDEHLLDAWCNGRPGCLRNPWVLALDDYVIFAADRAALEVWIDLYLVGNTLARKEDFLQLHQHNLQPAAAHWYLNGFHLLPLARAYAKTEQLANLAPAFGQIEAALQPASGLITFKGIWKPGAARQSPDDGAIAWKSLLDADALAAPSVIKLPEGYAIAVQDTSRQLYLFSADGALLWKRTLDGPLRSPVYAVTPADAATPLLLFNTSNSIYLTDLRGEPANNFPIHLQSPATNGLLPVDFDNNRNYNFFLSCANGNLYGYDITGRPLEGWNPLMDIGPLTYDMLHLQTASKDYLAALNERGEFHVLRKDAGYRFSPIKWGGTFLSPPACQNLPDTAKLSVYNRFVAVATTGNAQVVNLEGQQFSLSLAPPKAQNVRFAFGDVTGDARFDYVSLSDTTLAVYAYNGNKLEKILQQGIGWVPDGVFIVDMPGESHAAIGLWSASRRRIHLLHADGSPYPGFPLGGATPFSVVDLFGNQQRILVVANGDSVYAYRL